MNKISEDKLVTNSIKSYVDGVVTFDFEKGESPWHENGVKISYDDSEKMLVMKTIQETRPRWTKEQMEDIKKRILQSGEIIDVDVTGNTAYAKLVWDFKFDEIRKEITDYILLLKIEDEWKIVGKVFSEKIVDD